MEPSHDALIFALQGAEPGREAQQRVSVPGEGVDQGDARLQFGDDRSDDVKGPCRRPEHRGGV